MTIAIQIDARFPTHKVGCTQVPRMGTAKFIMALQPTITATNKGRTKECQTESKTEKNDVSLIGIFSVLRSVIQMSGTPSLQKVVG